MAAVIRMPEVATGTGEAAIQTWLVEGGTAVDAGQPIVEIETEKAVVEYETEVAGELAAILLPAGEAGAVGAPIAVVAEAGESRADALAAAEAEGVVVGGPPADAVPPAPAPTPTPTTAAASVTASEPVPTAVTEPVPTPESAAESVPAPPAPDAPAGDDAGPDSSAGRVFASPLVRRLAGERGIDLAAVRGSGPRGRVVRRDLDELPAPSPVAPAATTPVSTPVPPAPAGAQAPAPAGAEDIPHTGMRRAIARRLTEAKTEIPHIYLRADCRVDALLDLRARINEGRAADARVSVNDLVVKAVAAALLDVPEANAIWLPEVTRRFSGVDLAIAVSIPGGLVTPVVRGVDTLPVGRLGAVVRELAERARAGRLKQSELEGGSFSVSNLGMYGTAEFAAIINPPHSGILAVGAATRRPVIDDDGELSVATVMTVTLSADHRVLDGALAAQWLAAFVRRIEHPLSLLV
ncbi:MAG: pyruvate dehydrogenase complex dihydrolipoamide acetyltransferase [Microbacterium sp.]|nr:pyruvate dehydrogenase complex dihydrolipoamide acetyltransferase [Microbacterium sp.]